MSMFVTDFKWFDERSQKERIGYYMDEFLAINLMGIPPYLTKAWDVVGIISGHGKVRIGKSTMAQQTGYFLAWLLAGGCMNRNESTGKWFVSKHPDKQVNFNLKDNIVFDPDGLMKKAADLHKKYGRNQVIIYDEGRAGLDSASAMSAINKAMQDFFQECGQYGHVILVVLPNFFKLHEDYAVPRSLFLIDVYADKNLRRGFFSFYNESQKEWLYYLGKKRIGTSLKFGDTRPSFKGRFTPFLPIDKDEYDQAKADALRKKAFTRGERKWKKQRDAAIYLLYTKCELSIPEIAKHLTPLVGMRVGETMVQGALEAISHTKMDKGDEYGI